MVNNDDKIVTVLNKVNAYEFNKSVHKSIEDVEKDDWGILNLDNGSTRYDKSISSYYVNNWYEKVKEITFPTYIYPTLKDVPNMLPFKRSMTRHEHKSPSDSEHFGPIGTKKEMEKIFYTSLTCRTKPGKSYCVRKWMDLEKIEYRCTWNNYLTGVSTDCEVDTDIESLLKLITYVKSIEYAIPFTKCVFDIGIIKDTQKYILIEFNSWETMSKPHYFNWIDHTEFLYNHNGMTSVKTGPKNNTIQIKYNEPPIPYSFDINSTEIVIMDPIVPSGWIVNKGYLYVVNDIWLQKIRISDMVNVGWKRGVFRFGPMFLSDHNTLIVGTCEYSLDLKELCIITNPYSTENGDNLLGNKYRYGFRGKLNDINIFCRIDSNGDFGVEYIE